MTTSDENSIQSIQTIGEYVIVFSEVSRSVSYEVNGNQINLTLCHKSYQFKFFSSTRYIWRLDGWNHENYRLHSGTNVNTHVDSYCSSYDKPQLVTLCSLIKYFAVLEPRIPSIRKCCA